MSDKISIDTELLASIGNQIAQLEQELINVNQKMANAVSEVRRVAVNQDGLIRRAEKSVRGISGLSEKADRLSRAVSAAAQKWEETEKHVAQQSLPISEESGTTFDSYRTKYDMSTVSRDDQGRLVIEMGDYKTIIDDLNGITIVERPGGKSMITLGGESVQYPGWRFCVITEYDSNGNVTYTDYKLIKDSKYYGTYTRSITVNEDGTYTIAENATHENSIFAVAGYDQEIDTREYWAKEDKLLESDYSKQAIEAQKQLVSSGGEFSEEKWNKCKTAEEQDAFLYRLYNRICVINGADSSDIDFKVLHGTGEIKDQSQNPYTEKGWFGSETQKYHDTTLKAGVDGYYQDSTRTVRMRVTENTDYATLVANMSHECRHQVQCEIMRGGEIAEKYNVPQEYVDQMRYERDNYVSASDSNAVGTKVVTEAFKQEMKEMGIKDPEKYKIDAMVGEQYVKQQTEVDARSVEYEIRDAVKNSRNAGNGSPS